MICSACQALAISGGDPIKTRSTISNHQSRTNQELKIASLYRLILDRQPDNDEVAIGRQFIAAVEDGPNDAAKMTALQQYAQLLLLSNELMYID